MCAFIYLIFVSVVVNEKTKVPFLENWDITFFKHHYAGFLFDWVKLQKATAQ